MVSLMSLGINNGLVGIVISELVRPITTDINAIVTAAPQQRPEIHDLTLASENPAIDK
jgi:uncharacterized membrane protein